MNSGRKLYPKEEQEIIGQLVSLKGRLIERRKELNLSHGRLAERAGLEVPDVLEIEHGQLDKINLGTLIRVAVALGLKLELRHQEPVMEWLRKTKFMKATGFAMLFTLIFTAFLLMMTGFYSFFDYAYKDRKQNEQEVANQAAVSNQSNQSNRFEIVHRESIDKLDGLATNRLVIVRDKKTGVKYLIYQGYSKGGITPLVDGQGKVVVEK